MWGTGESEQKGREGNLFPSVGRCGCVPPNPAPVEGLPVFTPALAPERLSAWLSTEPGSLLAPASREPPGWRAETGGSCHLRCTRINYPSDFSSRRGPGVQLGSAAGSSLPPGCSAETNYELAAGLQRRFEALLVRQGPGPYLSGGHRALCGLSLGGSAGKPVSGRVGSGAVHVPRSEPQRQCLPLATQGAL